MNGLTPRARQQFEALHTRGMDAKNEGDHRQAFDLFSAADELAQEYGDNRKRLDALNPKARALWHMRDYGGATDTLAFAKEIARELDLNDEVAIAISNIGRVVAAELIDITPVDELPEALARQAVAHFARARRMLEGHSRYYYVYANASHGSVVAAVARQPGESASLIAEGMSVAFKISPEPYDQKETYKINQQGLGHMALAARLLYLGSQEPVHEEYDTQLERARAILIG